MTSKAEIPVILFLLLVLTWLLTAAGITINPPIAAAIAAVGMGVVGVIDALKSDSKNQ